MFVFKKSKNTLHKVKENNNLYNFVATNRIFTFYLPVLTVTSDVITLALFRASDVDERNHDVLTSSTNNSPKCFIVIKSGCYNYRCKEINQYYTFLYC